MVKSADLCDWSAVAGLSCNEFEPVVFGLHPELGRALRSLTAPGLSAGLARMSGSGSTLFRVGEEPGEPLPTLPPGFSALRTSTADHVEGPVLE
jgi:4-diphosphocytidyl-2C-methyl-D-erythritol kinase